jgi:putative ABC transport system ATP-binding protein
MADDLVLVARNLRKLVHDGERDVPILDGIDLFVRAGERVALIGSSGSGKSTLLHILGALDADYQGSVIVAGSTLETMSDDARSDFRNRTLGFVFQSYNLLGHLTAVENVLLPSRFADETPNLDRAYHELARVGLLKKANQRPITLSGGERQRVAIARALYHKPKLVLCDEPTGNLDRKTAVEILTLFESLAKEGVAMLIATHDAAIAESAARVLTLNAGRLE